MPRGKRTIKVPETDNERRSWLKLLSEAKQHVVEPNTGKPKRPQIDTWAAVDLWGFTPEEFRLLYCIARHEQWKNAPGGHRKVRLNGCYASADKLNQITGISRKKIFEILDLFQKAKILGEPKHRGRKPADRGKKNGPTLAGWTNEYEIQAISQWAHPWEFAELREKLLAKKAGKEEVAPLHPTSSKQEELA